MRTLEQITNAARQNAPATDDELRLAVCAYDVLMSKLKVAENPAQVIEYFIAAETDPSQYIGPKNDPKDPDVQEWHRAFVKAGDQPNEKEN